MSSCILKLCCSHYCPLLIWHNVSILHLWQEENTKKCRVLASAYLNWEEMFVSVLTILPNENPTEKKSRWLLLMIPIHKANGTLAASRVQTAATVTRSLPTHRTAGRNRSVQRALEIVKSHYWEVQELSNGGNRLSSKTSWNNASELFNIRLNVYTGVRQSGDTIAFLMCFIFSD